MPPFGKETAEGLVGIGAQLTGIIVRSGEHVYFDELDRPANDVLAEMREDGVAGNMDHFTTFLAVPGANTIFLAGDDGKKSLDEEQAASDITVRRMRELSTGSGVNIAAPIHFRSTSRRRFC